MDGLMNGWMEGWKDGWMINGWMDRRKVGRKERLDGWFHSWMNGLNGVLRHFCCCDLVLV
jgi:hypothetical protein